MLIKLGKVAGTFGLLIILVFGRAFATYLTATTDGNAPETTPTEVIDPQPNNSLAAIDH